MKGRRSLKGQEAIVNERSSPCHARRGGGGEKDAGKVKSDYIKSEKNNDTYNVKNRTENPAYNSGNVSCATNEWLDYPD